MADRYPTQEYGRDGRGRYGKSEHWRDNDSRYGASRYRSDEDDFDEDPRGYGAYGGAYGQDESGNYAGGYDRNREEGRGRYGGYSQGGMRGQSYGGGGYRDRDDWDRSYGLQGSGYSQEGQSQYGPQGHGPGRYGQEWGQQGSYGARRMRRTRGWDQGSETGRGYDQGYRQQGFGGFGAYEEGGSFAQGGPGMGGQGYSNQDVGGYEGSFGQGGSFGGSAGFGSEQSGSYLTRGGRSQWGRHSGRGPKNYTRSDDRIREDVNDRLTDDPLIDASDIDVKVSSCEVTLTGTVESRQAKRRAEDCVESVSGVKHVQNNLRVQSPGDEESTRSTSGGKKNKAGGDSDQRMQ